MQYIANNGNKNKELLLKHFLELFQLYIFIFFFYINFYPLQRATVLLALKFIWNWKSPQCKIIF